MSEVKSKVDYNEKVLEVKNLKKYFFVGVGKNKLVVPAVDNISFDIYKREVFGLVGESGSGKTTAGRTVIKLYTPTEGTVKLNNAIVNAGYVGYENQIKRIKRKSKGSIKGLYPEKSKIYDIQKKYNKQISLIDHEIALLNQQYNENLKEARIDYENYKAKKYALKNEFVLTKEKVIFDTNIAINEIKKKATNQAKNDYQNEIKIANIIYQKKEQGIKDSAALDSEVIKQRLSDLKQEHQKTIKDLEDKYTPLIASASKNVMPKDEAKSKIKECLKTKNEAIRKISTDFKAEFNNIKAPDKTLIEEKVLKVKNDYEQKREVLVNQINALKEKEKAEVSNVPKDNLSLEEIKQIQDKIKEIRMESENQIKELKLKISEVKRVNNARETLETSRKMQMIFQDPISSLNPRMTVREIVSEGLTIQGNKNKEEVDRLVKEALEIVGLAPEYVTRYPHEFSGGQRQRIGIARALIMNPNFIIADEPISALDVSIRAQVINLLTDLKDKLGLTILFIAHDLSVVRFFCDRIAVMHQGKIVELASSEELFKNPLHPYTISLLSAIPEPDPDYEKGRTRIHYNPLLEHNYRIDKPELHEIFPGHFVYANEPELEKMKKNYKK